MDTDTIDFRLKMTNFIKKVILVNINTLLQEFTNELNEKEDQVCSMYGNYAYLSLLDELGNSIICNKKDDIDITDIGDDFEINCDLEKTLTNLNMLVINKQNTDDIMTQCTLFLNKVEELLNEKFSDRLTFIITKSLNRELFKGIRLSLQVKSKRRSIRFGLTDLDFIYTDSVPLLNIDIYTENINIPLFKENLIEINKDNITTLSKCGYIILSSFVYYDTLTEIGLRLNKIRFETILRTFRTEEEAFKCVIISNDLFQDYTFRYTSRASFILKRFLIRFNINDESGMPFSSLESELNHHLLTQKLFVNKTLSLRDIIDSFIKETDSQLQLLDYGRFLKVGGDAFNYHSQHEELLNDIDTKIFLKDVTIKNKQKVCDNIVSTLFFMIDRLNYFKNEKIDIVKSFIFAGRQMQMILQNDYLTINYSSVELVQITINVNTNIVIPGMLVDVVNDIGEIQKIPLQLKHITRSDPFDVWIYRKSIIPEINKDELYISLDYFIQNLQESFIKTDKRIDRFYNGKLKKDKVRLGILRPRLVEESEEKQPERKRKLVKSEEEQPEKKRKLVKLVKDIKFIKDIINLFWTIPPGGIDRTFISILKAGFLSYTKENNEETYVYMNRFLPDYFNGSLVVHSGGPMIEFIFTRLLLLITKLKEIDYSSYSVIINSDPFFYKKFYDKYNWMCKIKIEELVPKDLVYLIWYSSNSTEHQVFNEKLRNREELTFNENKIKTRLDYILSKGKLYGTPERPIILYRGINMKVKDFKKENFVSKSYLSTSIDKDSASFFTNATKCCLMKIIIKREIEGIYLNLIDIGIEYEKEVLLPRDLELIYKESYIDIEGYITNVYEVGNHMLYERRIVEEEQKVERQHVEEKQEQSIIVSEEQKVQINPVPKFNNDGERIKFMKEYIYGKKFDKEQLRLFIISVNNGSKRKGKTYDNYFERYFGSFCLQYLKEHLKIEYDFSTTLNSTLTLEYEDKSLNTTLRQLLNTFVSTTHNLLKNAGIGKLYKTGGEAIRYYTKNEGDKVTNDIDSKFCCNKPLNLKTEKLKIFRKIAMMLIFLAITVKFCNFKIEHFSLIEKGTNFGYITSYQEIGISGELIPEYIAVRTNYVGDCWQSKNNQECLNIISLDKNHKIVLDGLRHLFNGEIIHFYSYAAPYDFLFSNEHCKDVDIQERKDDSYPKNPRNPPVVSLSFVIRDSINLLTPREYKTTYKTEESKADVQLIKDLEAIGITGDLEKRINSGKHNKDIKRYKALIKVYNEYKGERDAELTPYEDENTKDRTKQLLKLFKEIDKIKGEVDVDKDVDKLDQTCDYTKPGICLDLQKRLVECWRDRHINQKISQDADYLFTIFQKNPGQFVKVPV
jgi:hypothetical protein